jgi:hypothetical protein
MRSAPSSSRRELRRGHISGEGRDPIRPERWHFVGAIGEVDAIEFFHQTPCLRTVRKLNPNHVAPVFQQYTLFGYPHVR